MKTISLIQIQKRKDINSSFNRYYTVWDMRHVSIESFPFKTEVAMAKALYDRFGEGRYLIKAYKGGRIGFWKFWHGELNKEGFIRVKKWNMQKKKQTKRLKNAMDQTEDEEEKEWLQDEIDYLDEEGTDVKPMGFWGFLKSATPVGSFHNYEED